jgi:hypothetical protein
MNTHTEFPIDLDEECEGLGTLIVTDAQLLLRPPVEGQYPSRMPFDTARVHEILDIGDLEHDTDTVIFCRSNPAEAARLLDRVFYVYLDGYCMGKVWADARVRFYLNDEVVGIQEHGFEDGNFTMNFSVICSVQEDEVDRLIAERTGSFSSDERYVVVRPDSSESGYALNGFIAGDHDESNLDDNDRFSDSVEDYLNAYT